MNSASFESVRVKQLEAGYAKQAQQALSMHSARINLLLNQGRCPDVGWDDSTIELFLQNLALMDSNNFLGCAQLGERESRFASEIVRRRHFRMGHGIGRSGDILEQQPKAAGSTLMNRLTNSMLLHILRASGAPSTEACFVVPTATGMALVLCLLAFRAKKPNAKYVVWPRIDQKTCFKSIITAGLRPIVINEQLSDEKLVTNIAEMRKQIIATGAENILCVLSTTSCFAPRCPDDLIGIASICSEFNLMHLVNNAYGVQSMKCMSRVEQASKHGRVDAYVQSTDKNFMVPVGGAVIAGFDEQFVYDIAQTYPGRGSGTPTMDLFITLLSLGVKGYREACDERKIMFAYLKTELERIAKETGQLVLRSEPNDISVALTINGVMNDVGILGSMLFTKFVFGTRAIDADTVKYIEGRRFIGWGAHSEDYPHNYLTMA
ncbi:O-phosphoseryl-tRNA(Sec) selenium transferase-like, partial [Tropilaelaps mercedesae]